MALLALGCFIMFLGFAFIGLPELNRVLKLHDRLLWDSLFGSQSRFMSAFNPMTLFTWTLGRGFENSDNIDIQYAGLLAYKRATRVKYTILAGLSLVIIGSIRALTGL